MKCYTNVCASVVCAWTTCADIIHLSSCTPPTPLILIVMANMQELLLLLAVQSTYSGCLISALTASHSSSQSVRSHNWDMLDRYYDNVCASGWQLNEFYIRACRKVAN